MGVSVLSLPLTNLTSSTYQSAVIVTLYQA